MPEAPAVAEGWVFELPSLGADMDIGTILEWRVGPGDEIAKGDVVARVETEKSDIDVEIWQSGTVTELLAPVGSEIPVGTPILLLDVTDHPTTEDRMKPPPVLGQDRDDGVHQPGSAPVVTNATTRPERVLSSPRARMLAAERGIDLKSVIGSGPDGAVTERDLDQPVASPAAGPSAGDRMRKVIADRMTQANSDIPHYHLDLDVNLENAIGWLAKHNESRPVSERVLPAALFVRAVAVAARKVPHLNGTWENDQLRMAPSIDVAVAVSLRKGGLVTPVVTDADSLDVDQTMSSLQQLVTGARSGSMKSSWMAPATITVTNLGENGADRVSGVIFPPQVALVGFGRVRITPAVVDGQVVPRPVVTVTLSADHRATDGATGSRFLSKISDYLQHPEE